MQMMFIELTIGTKTTSEETNTQILRIMELFISSL